MANVPLILAALGTAAVVYYGTRKKPAATGYVPGLEGGEAPPPPEPGILKIPAGLWQPPGAPPGEPEPIPGGIQGAPWGAPIPGEGGGAGVAEGAYCATVGQQKSGSVEGSTRWIEKKKEKIILLTRAPGSPCKKYRAVFGVCVIPKNVFYGILTQYLNGEIIPPPFQINDGFGVPDLNQFKSPHVWKQIYDVDVTFKDNGNPTISTKLYQTPGSVMDPCPNNPKKWPTPPNKYFNIKNINGDWLKWYPEPSVKFTGSGSIVHAEVEYTGLPPFITIADEGIADTVGATAFTISYKISSIGFES